MSDDLHRPLKFGEAGPEIQRLREENQHIRGAYEDCREEWRQMATHNAEQAAEITRLRAALATARQDALAEIKQDTDELIEQGRQDGMEQAAQIGDRHIEIGEVLSETEADKRLADNIKMQVGAMKQVVDAIRAAAKEGE